MRWGTAVCFVGLLVGCGADDAPGGETDDAAGSSSSTTADDDADSTTFGTSSDAGDAGDAGSSEGSSGGSTGSLSCGEFGCGSPYGDDCSSVSCVDGECVYGDRFPDFTQCTYDDGFDYMEGYCFDGSCNYDCY